MLDPAAALNSPLAQERTMMDARRMRLKTAEPQLDIDSVLVFDDFEEEDWAAYWGDAFEDRNTRVRTTEPAHVFRGLAACEERHQEGSHNPFDLQQRFQGHDEVYLRWYTMLDEGYEVDRGVKMSGLAARDDTRPYKGAGIRPNGKDKFSCRLTLHRDWTPVFYTYHMDQLGRYGDILEQNVGTPVKLETMRWYCLEMMLKANSAPKADGELKLWIDGDLKGHYDCIRFRDVNTLRADRCSLSAYFGGSWSSPKDQRRWVDDYVVASAYVGPTQEH
jgi:hypothetical protein